MAAGLGALIASSRTTSSLSLNSPVCLWVECPVHAHGERAKTLEGPSLHLSWSLKELPCPGKLGTIPSVPSMPQAWSSSTIVHLDSEDRQNEGQTLL